MPFQRLPLLGLLILTIAVVGAVLVTQRVRGPQWRALEPGLEFTTIHGGPYCRRGSANIAVLRVDPRRFRIGVRHFSTGTGETPPGALDWLWEGAEKAGVPVMMMCSGHVETVPAVAAAHPDLKLTVDHLGLGQQKDDEAFGKLDLLLDLAKYPNVSVKACTLPIYSTEAYPYRNTHKYLKRVYDAFGANRVFWGSDLTRLPGSYRECVTMFTEALDFLSDADKEATMGRALCDWIGWKV